ncbi:MAG TPA: hypothetical protein VHQ90_04190 [Thermoanaerobaculia bacterium]|nr:hypothetical protein [Thermoanaerobaculia bacterium]
MNREEVNRYAKLLQAVVQLSRLSEREVERRLGLGGGTLNRIFTRRIELKLFHVLAILEAVDMRPEQFFQLASVLRRTVGDSPDNLGRQVIEALGKLAARVGPRSEGGEGGVGHDAAAADKDLDRRVAASLRRLGLSPPGSPPAAGRGSGPRGAARRRSRAG